MNKKYIVRLEETERAELTRLVSVGKAAARKLVHARVLLKADAVPGGPGWTDAQIAEALDMHPNTVVGIRQRFVEQGLEAALNRKKRATPPRPRRLDGRQEARLIALACGRPPEGRARWTLRLLADRMVALNVVEDLSYETVRRTLKKTR
jgi:transposase